MNSNWSLTGLESKKINCNNLEKVRFLKLKIFFIYIYSIYKVLEIYLRQLLIKNDSTKIDNADILILETEKEYRHYNINKVKGKNLEEIFFLKIFEKQSMMTCIRIKFFDLFAQLVKTGLDFRRGIINNTLKTCILEYMIIHGRQLPSYVYFVCFFKKLKETNNDISIYSGGAILASHAAIENNINCNYITHGTIGTPYSVDLFPNFNEFYVYSEYERNFLLKNGISSNIVVYKSGELSTNTMSVVIFLGLPEDIEYKNLIKVVEFFKLYNYDVHIKMHPLCNKRDYKIKKLDGLILDEFNDAESILCRIKPKFSIGHYSTALCISLNMGIVPILLDFNKIGDEFLYPYNKMSVSWVNGRDYIKKSMFDSRYYKNIVKKLQNVGLANYD